MELLSHMVTLCLVFQGLAKLFSKAAVSFNIPTSGDCGSDSHIFMNTCHGHHLKNVSYLRGRDMASHCGVISLSLLTDSSGHLFCAFQNFAYFIWISLFSRPSSSFTLVSINHVSVPYFEYQYMIKYKFARIFSMMWGFWWWKGLGHTQ